MAYDALEASGYGNNIAVAIIDDDMHLAPKDHKTEYNAFLRYLTDKISIIQRYGTIEDIDRYENLYQMMKSDYGKYVALSGFDAYKAGKNIVILNRSKLKIGETNERLERIALDNT